MTISRSIRKIALVAAAAGVLGVLAYSQAPRASSTPVRSSARMSTRTPDIKPPDVVTAQQETPAMDRTPSLPEQERFLATARIVKLNALDLGLTKSMKIQLTDGKLTHAAHLQQIDVFQPEWRGKNGSIEKNFKDTYKFNIAAYRLAKLLGLADMVPASVYREVNGKPSAVTWWVDNLWMTELQRRQRNVAVPVDQNWINQLAKVRVFDQLIYNTDRNQGNLLITHDWKVWMIDHTRAFRTSPTLMNQNALTRIDYRLMDALRKLRRDQVVRAEDDFLTPQEIDALMARRDLIIRYFQSEISKKGDVAVLTDMPRSTPRATIP